MCRPSSLHRAVAGQRGSVAAEYAVLLTLLAIGCALAIGGLGVPLVRRFVTQQTWLLLPVSLPPSP